LGVIHRDIRPENILVFSPNLVKLGDFSNAITQGEALPQEELLKAQGSLLYMPPEVITGGQPSPKGDLYSLGITFLELMRGSNPFEKIPLIQSLAARESLALDPLEDIPFDLRYTLRLLIQFDLLFRPKTAKEALSYLENPELAENKWRNLDELLKKSTPQDMHYEKQYDQKTIVLSEEEIIERIKQADSNSPRKSLLDIFKNAKNWFSKIAFVANLRRVSETRILLVLLAVSVIATASFLWLSGKEKVEANQIEIAKQWLPISMLEIPDGIYKATFSRALPVFDSIEAVIVKSDGRMHVSFLLDVAITSSAPMGEGSVILDAMTQQLRLFNPRSNKNHFILETVNLDNNLTGLLKLELLKPL
ncbi:MAG: protein kinase, partial [Deltaproteobacteria bacterium]|nr:protein kinase [Deltaproteobacteria bacterium]